jgi:hydroxymethylpyrimidine/phosphomethylpyrimidine kinase
MRVYGMACVTALTVQSTQGVRRVVPVDPDIVVETLDCLAEDASFSCIKVGILGNSAVAAAVFRWLRAHPEVKVVLDPVGKSSSGKDLLDPEGQDLMRTEGLARANWITPNLSELALITNLPLPIAHVEVEAAARQLLELAGEQNNPGLRIVVTGGHAPAPDDLFLTQDTCRWYRGEFIPTLSTHGTGCAFSSALASRLALGDDDGAAVQGAKNYVSGTLRHAYPVGRGNGPGNHFWQT